MSWFLSFHIRKLFLTTSIPQRISVEMGRVLHFILILIFLAIGVSQVPACYATKPNCNLKATSDCPMAKAKEMGAPDRSLPCCLLDQATKKQQSTTTSFPLDRLKRLKIDQIQPDVASVPPFVPKLFSRIIIKQPETNLPNILFTHRFDNPYRHPPALFLQHQSFLIWYCFSLKSYR